MPPAPRRPSRRPAIASVEELEQRRTRLAALCESFPETTTVTPAGTQHLSLEVSGKRFGYYLYQHFGDDGRSGAVLKAAPGVQEMAVEEDPDRFWVPAFLGRHGWIGIRLDLEEPDWDELAAFVRDAWLLMAPKRLLRELDSFRPG